MNKDDAFCDIRLRVGSYVHEDL